MGEGKINENDPSTGIELVTIRQQMVALANCTTASFVEIGKLSVDIRIQHDTCQTYFEGNIK